MNSKKLIGSWPVYRQLTGDDPLARGQAAIQRSLELTPRTAEAVDDATWLPRTARSDARRRCTSTTRRSSRSRAIPTAPFREVACAQGFCEQTAVTGPQRLTKVRYRPPYATEWSDLDLDTAMGMVADRVLDARERLEQLTRTATRCAARWASPASAARPWTTKRTT